jgi:hypothetical protein
VCVFVLDRSPQIFLYVFSSFWLAIVYLLINWNWQSASPYFVSLFFLLNGARSSEVVKTCRKIHITLGVVYVYQYYEKR